MFKNYLKIAYRHISRNKSFVFINVFGLGIAIALTLLGYINYQAGASADSFHENEANIYRIIASHFGSDGLQANIETPLAIMAPSDIDGVKTGVRFGRRSVIVKRKDEVFHERIGVVDPNFLQVFTFPLLEGDAQALNDPSQILVTEETAIKYFGKETALGQVLSINPGSNGQKDFVVGGVMADLPTNSSIQFSFLTNISYVENGINPDTLSSWRNREDGVFLVLDDKANSQNVESKLSQYIPVQNDAAPGSKRVKYHLQPMGEVFQSQNMSNNNLKNAITPSFYWGPGIMALLILLTACLNFTNTTISFSNKRLKEMGIRKVMGGGRQQLIFQLLGESLVICVLAAGLGVVLAEYLTPLYNQMWESVNLNLSVDYFHNPDLLVFLIGIVLFTALLGGAYPAFYISSFKPSNIFRGNSKFGGDNWMVRSLLGLQIAISLVSIIGGITFFENSQFQQNFDLGYNINNIINVSIDGKSYEPFKNIISENKDILGVTGSVNNLGFGNWWNNIGKVEDNRHAQVQYIGENFLEVMDLNLMAGRAFDKNLETDYTESVIINQKLAKEQQWDDPIGEQLEMFDTKFNVVGLVADFYPSSFFNTPSPGVFHFRKPEKFRTMKIKVSADKLVATNDYLKEKWTQTFPLLPFNSFYQDEVLSDMLSISKNVAYLNFFLALISILLAATGLFSLVSLNVLKRAKEIAIRRVLGASVENITYLINKHYVLVFILGGLLGALLGGWFTQFLIETIFKVHQDVQITSVVFSVIGICIVGALTIGGKLINVLKTNPADTLKSE